MKKRKLRTGIEKALIAITTMLFIFAVSINDFELKGIPLIIGLWSVVLINSLIIKKYGRGVWNGK